MRDVFYQFLTGALDLVLWGGELAGEENLPQRGPAVFVANHLDAQGPIAAVCSIPIRLYPWIAGEMLDRERAAAYLDMDFVERQLHLKPPLGLGLARTLSRITVPLLRSLGCVPVHKGDYEGMQETLELSMDVLRQGHFLLGFPEDNLLPSDPLTKMRPFQRSFARLGESYYEETGQRLAFYPVAIHAAGTVRVGRPVAFNPFNRPGFERHRLKDLLENTVRAMYLELDGQDLQGALTPQHK